MQHIGATSYEESVWMASVTNLCAVRSMSRKRYIHRVGILENFRSYVALAMGTSKDSKCNAVTVSCCSQKRNEGKIL